MKNDAINHYDLLIAEDNDSVRDPEPLKEYMNKWDGPTFIEQMQLDSSKSVLEVSVGTGRFVLSIDKNPSEFIDIGTRKIRIYPDTRDAMAEYINVAGLTILDQYDTEFATIFVAQKDW